MSVSINELKLPYKVKKFIREKKDLVDSCIIDAVDDKLDCSNRALMFITDFEYITDYIIDYQLYDRDFYWAIIQYCKHLLESEGYYVKLRVSGPNDLDLLSKLEEFTDDSFKPFMYVFKEEKYYKRDKATSEGCTLLGAVLGLITGMTED